MTIHLHPVHWQHANTGLRICNQLSELQISVNQWIQYQIKIRNTSLQYHAAFFLTAKNMPTLNWNKSYFGTVCKSKRSHLKCFQYRCPFEPLIRCVRRHFPLVAIASCSDTLHIFRYSHNILEHVSKDHNGYKFCF